MQYFKVSTNDLQDWAWRKKAIEDIEGSEGYSLLMARMRQEEQDAEQELLKCSRWNWFRILKALIKRDCASTLRVYVDGVKRMGVTAESELKKRDPKKLEDLKRPSFVASPQP